MTSLPSPGPAALAHSHRLAAAIQAEIEASGGWLDFARFMERALYAPGLGYYSAGSRKIGAEGDFVTAPEISPLFGRALARQVAEILGRSGGDVLELGAGSGRLAVDLLRGLEECGCPLRHYLILEVSADLAERQRNQIARQAPEHLPRCRWLEALPETFAGVVLANEVLDALPVHLLAWRKDGVYERGAVVAGEGFGWEERLLGPGPLWDKALRLGLPTGAVTEIGLAAPRLVHTLGKILKQGVLLLLDYGFPEREYYHPQRSGGTLMCHYRHRTHDDPLWLPGLQDITSHVNFTAIGEAGTAAGLELLGYTSQARFLINCGIVDLLAQTPAEDIPAYLPQAGAVQRLLSPAEMGELFKVMALGKDCMAPLLGFGQGDRRRSLAPDVR